MTATNSFWLTVAVACATLACTHANIVVSRASRCPGYAGDDPNLESILARQQGTVESALRSTRTPFASLGAATKTGVERALHEAPGPWLLWIHSGHGKADTVTIDGRPRTGSVLCLPPADLRTSATPSTFDGFNPDASARIDRMPAAFLEGGVRGAVFVINACQSAHVDPRLANNVPFSVISASPFNMRADALLGERLGDALDRALDDPNCDGIVTDEELFSELLAIWRREVPVSIDPTYPKLRRQATSHIPLPVTPRPRAECASELPRMQAIIAQRASSWGDLGRALRTQLELARGATTLPASDNDYFLLRAGTGAEASSLEQVKNAARAAHLVALPFQDEGLARQIAQFAIFAEMYALTVKCGSVTVERLRDGAVIGVHPLGPELGALLPSRRGRSWSGVPDEEPRARVSFGEARPGDGIAAPCFEDRGQCFDP